jgi:hypothetical protein
MTLGLRAAAKQLGISHVRLLTLWQEGRIPRNADKSFDLDAVRAAFGASKDPGQPGKIKTPQAEPEGVPQAIGMPSADAGFYKIRTALHAVKLRASKMDLAEREGELVRASEVLREWERFIAACKNRLLLLPAKLAPRVAGMTNATDCHVLMDREIRDALMELSGYTPAAE